MVNMKKAALTRNKRTTLTTHISALIAIKIRSPPSATGAPLPHPTTLELLSVSQRRTSLDHIPTHDCEVVRRAHLGREDTTPPSSALPLAMPLAVPLGVPEDGGAQPLLRRPRPLPRPPPCSPPPRSPPRSPEPPPDSSARAAASAHSEATGRPSRVRLGEAAPMGTSLTCGGRAAAGGRTLRGQTKAGATAERGLPVARGLPPRGMGAV